MQKVLDFLERHVQWVAIAIAALFMLYAFSAYLPVVAKPIAVDIGGTQLTPGEVDPTIRTEAEALQGRIDAAGKVSITVPDYLGDLRQKLAAPVPAAKLPSSIIVSQPVEYPQMPWDQSQGSGDVANNKVNDLPVLPPVIYDTAPTTDFAQVTLPPAPGQPAAAAAAAPAAPAAPGAAATAVSAVDTTWVRVPFTVPAGNIAKAFSNANIPANLMLTSFLRVELIREKQLPGNLWGPPEVVDLLPTIAMPPMPAEGPQNLAQQQQYTGWANSNQNVIVQPDFFPVLAGGDPRFSKPVDAAAAPGTPVAFDPETFPPAGAPGGDITTLTPEQKAAVLAVRKRKAEEAKQNTPRPPTGGGPEGGGGSRGPRGGPGGGGPRGPGGGGRGGGYSLPATGGNGAGITGDSTFQYRPPAGNMQGRPPTQGTGLPPGAFDPGMPGMGGMGGMPNYPQPGAPVQIQFTPVPNPGPWAPQQIANGIIEGWAYDVTAAADSTYRYRIRYTLKNPIFGVQNVANKPALIAVFGLVGEDQDTWTAPIAIAPLTHVYLSALPQAGSNRVGFTVFRWQAGKRHRTNVFVGPGDSIGKVDGDVDYRTHWTLVETRRDSSASNVYALLMNADGVLKKVDFDADKQTPLFQQLNAEVDGPATPAGASGSTPGDFRPPMGAPGGPPPPYGPRGPAGGGNQSP